MLMIQPMTRVDTPRPRLVIQGVGLISPLGLGAWPTFRALSEARSIADRTANFINDLDPVAVVQGIGHVAVARQTRDDPAAELAERALREACHDAGVEPTKLPTWIGTSKGAVARRFAVDSNQQTSEDHATWLAMGPQGYLSHRLRVRAGVSVISHQVAACGSSLVALDSAAKALRSAPEGSMDRALVVTAEAALLPTFIASYRRLGVLAEATPDGYRQYPLDQRRKGFMLSELSAAVVLKRLAPDEPMPKDSIELVDTAMLSEAFDMIRASPRMPALHRVAEELLAGRPIDVLHPHAPGTPDHDPIELGVLADVLNREREMTQAHREVSVYACKGGLGHGLGSAGLVALVIACLSARSRKLPPMPWLEQPIGSGLPLSGQAKTLPNDSTHVVFAAGFGGATAGAVIRHQS